MKAITMTYTLAMVAAHDAGNRSMRKAGRTKWNREDWTRALLTGGVIVTIITMAAAALILLAAAVG